MRRFKVLVIGQGFMGGNAHPKAILGANYLLREYGVEFELTCIAGTDAERLAKTQTKFGFLNATTDYASAIAAVDMVVVATPNYLHHPMVMAALNAGKIVVCEKPLGTTVDEAEEMAAGAEANGKPNMVTFCYRGASGPLQARKMVREGRIIGKSGWFEGSSDFLQDWGIGGRTNHRFDPKNGLGGIILDLLAHSIDLAQFVIGKEVLRVTAHTRLYHGDGEDLMMVAGTGDTTRAVDAVDALCTFAGGNVMRMSASRSFRGHKAFMPLVLHGYRGALQWELQQQQNLRFLEYVAPTPDGMRKTPDNLRGWRDVHLSDPGENGHPNTRFVPGLVTGYDGYFQYLYEQFGLSLIGEHDTSFEIPTFATGLQVQRVCEAAYKSGFNDGETMSVS